MQLIESEPELFPYSTRLATGVDPENDPQSSSLAELTSLYFKGPGSYAAGIPGANPLDRALDDQSLALLSYSESDSVATVHQKLVEVMGKALGRTQEIASIHSAVLKRSEFTQAVNTTDKYNIVLSPSHHCDTQQAQCTVSCSGCWLCSGFKAAATLYPRQWA